MEDNSENERLQAFCSVTFDDAYVVRDLKIIEGTKGSFVAMPIRKLTDRCPGCGSKNHLRVQSGGTALGGYRPRPMDISVVVLPRVGQEVDGVVGGNRPRGVGQRQVPGVRLLGTATP